MSVDPLLHAADQAATSKHLKPSRESPEGFTFIDSPLRQFLYDIVFSSGLSNHELARRSGLSQTLVSLYLHNLSMGSLASWSSLLEACGVNIDVDLDYHIDVLKFDQPVQVTPREMETIGSLMAGHGRMHAVENTTCDAACSREAMRRAINATLKEK